MKKIFYPGLLLGLVLYGFVRNPRVSSDRFFALKVQVGDRIGNIFSRTISYKGDSFPEIAYRVGGTGVYTVIDNNAAKPVFEGVFRYDGRPESSGRVEISDGGKTSSWNGKASVNTDASGVMYNSLIWGIPPAKIGEGDSWNVTIPQSWELGGAGVQKVTVMEMDEKNNTVRLKREGSAEGWYDNDARQVNVVKKPAAGATAGAGALAMTITPGLSHWTGYTTFKNGLVISDELLVSRPVTLTADGLRYEAFQREYILLNEMPVP